ncbi:MAG TPA: nuclear transport factor 2 family protein [Thermoanaerobaculia bacterium]|nr:nuclear transport factor 2 family protein [Thermoanaerobaculia bacterium]
MRLALILLLAGCATVPRETPRDTVQRFIGAFNHLDAAELRPLLAEHATAFLPMPQHAGRVEGRETILGILAPLLEADRVRRNGQPLSLEAKELAIQEQGDVAVATFDAGTADVHSRRTLVLRRRGGRWEIVHLHASNMRP